MTSTPDDGSDLRPLRAVVAGMWPSPDAPERGIFVKRQVRALRELGLQVEVAPMTSTDTGMTAMVKYFELARTCVHAVETGHADVLHGHYLFPTGWAVRRAARRLNVPYVMTVHGTDIANATSSNWLRRLSTPVVRDAAGIIAVSEELAGAVRELWPTAQVAVAHMGVDTATYAPPASAADRESARTRAYELAGLAPGPIVVAVGNLIPVKGHHHLIAAWPEVVESAPDARLVIVGSGPEEARLRADIDRLSLGDNVSLVGRQDPAVVVDLLQAADAATLVSDREGFGLSALEALACGVPVAAASAVPVSDLITEGLNGALATAGSPRSIARAVLAALTLTAPCDAATTAAAAHDTISQAMRVQAMWMHATGRHSDA